MSSILWDLVDKTAVEYAKAEAKKKRLKMVVCGFNSYFRDDVMDVCSKCKSIVYIRPKIREIALKYKVPIVCVNCADKKEVAVATAKILDKIKSRLNIENTAGG